MRHLFKNFMSLQFIKKKVKLLLNIFSIIIYKYIRSNLIKSLYTFIAMIIFRIKSHFITNRLQFLITIISFHESV